MTKKGSFILLCNECPYIVKLTFGALSVLARYVKKYQHQIASIINHIGGSQHTCMTHQVR